MANLALPFEERNLSPDQVERLDARRRRGQLFLVIGFQAAIVSAILLLWVGQDLTYSTGWNHMIFFWMMVTGGISAVSLLVGLNLRRGLHEFTSY